MLDIIYNLEKLPFPNMFENDFNLDENWFKDDLPTDLHPTTKENTQDSTRIIQSNFNLQTNKNEANKLQKNKSPKVVLKRKFPGPAGLFPETQDLVKSKSDNDDSSENNSSFILSTQFLCSQNTVLTFQKPTWLDMCKEFNSENESSLLNKYNIEWIHNNVSHNLIDKRVPFLAAIIKEVKNTSKSPIFMLIDLTGEMEALISMELYEEYNEYLSVDSVIILKQFTIFSVSSSKHYINITSDNLVRIYSCKDLAEDDVKIVHIQKISNNDIERETNEFVNRDKQLKHGEISKNNAESNKGLNDLNKMKCFRKNYNSKDNNVDNNILNNKINRNYMKISEPNLNVIMQEDVVLKSWSNNFTNERNINESSDVSLNIENNDLAKSNMKNVEKKFKFKDVLLSKEDKLKRLNENPSTSMISRNIFDNANSSVDLDLNIDDFQDEFVIPRNNKETNISSDIHDKSNTNRNNINTKLNRLFKDSDDESWSKKRKLDIFENKSSIETVTNFEESSIENILNDLRSERHKNNLGDTNLQSQINKIDCTQISILSQNNESSDVIKEIFSDLDAAALFDDF